MFYFSSVFFSFSDVYEKFHKLRILSRALLQKRISSFAYICSKLKRLNIGTNRVLPTQPINHCQGARNSVYSIFVHFLL